jgi:hypothetical protein
MAKSYLERLKEYPNAFEYCLGATDDEIKFAEKQLGVLFPKNYRQFLSECGMCNFGDARIDGIFKTETQTVYSVVEYTLRMRESGNLPNDLIVLDFEEQEYLILYKVSEREKVEDGFVFGAEVHYVENEKIKIGKPVKQFDSFEEYFEDFLELGK